MAENTSIQLSKTVAKQLKAMRMRSESYEDIITRLMREADFTEKVLGEKFENKRTIDEFAKVVAARLKERYLITAR